MSIDFVLYFTNILDDAMKSLNEQGKHLRSMETCDDEVLRLRLTHILLSALTGRPLLTTCGSSARYLKCVYTADGAKSKFVWPTFSRS